MKRHLLPTGAVSRARTLRREMTEAERILWSALRTHLRRAHFRRQTPLGPYFADFVSHGAKMIVELDGSQHAQADAQVYDRNRTGFLNAEGYRVLRFWNNEVLGNLDGVLTVIAAQLPSPLVGEGGPSGRMRGARQSRAPASGRHPHPSPPRKAEGATKAGSIVRGKAARRPAADTPHPLPSPTRGEGGSVKSVDLESA